MHSHDIGQEKVHQAQCYYRGGWVWSTSTLVSKPYYCHQVLREISKMQHCMFPSLGILAPLMTDINVPGALARKKCTNDTMILWGCVGQKYIFITVKMFYFHYVFQEILKIWYFMFSSLRNLVPPLMMTINVPRNLMGRSAQSSMILQGWMVQK